MLVSVLIPCFNAEKFIAQAIESALEQSWSPLEVIVVDDGSTDSSLEVIKKYDGRIRWEAGPNRGGNVARNRLLELARGEWLQYLDADDYLLPDKIARQMDFLSSYRNADVIFSPTLCEKIINGKPALVDEPIPRACSDPWVLLALWQLPQTGGPLWRRAALQKAGGWRNEQPCCQEHELYFRTLAAGSRVEFMHDSSAVYRNWDIGGRLTTKFVYQVPAQRLIILDRMEEFLAGSAALTSLRRQAINDARHQMARTMWHHDRSLAQDMIGRILQSDANFCPSPGPASSVVYRTFYRFLGFRGAEHVGRLARAVALRRHQAAAESLGTTAL